MCDLWSNINPGVMLSLFLKYLQVIFCTFFCGAWEQFSAGTACFGCLAQVRAYMFTHTSARIYKQGCRSQTTGSLSYILCCSRFQRDQVTSFRQIYQVQFLDTAHSQSRFSIRSPHMLQRSEKVEERRKKTLEKRLEKGGTPRSKNSRRGQSETNLRRSH